MAERLSKSQVAVLQRAVTEGGVTKGWARERGTCDALVNRNYFDRPEMGYYRITDAGRAALREIDSKEKTNG